MAKQEFFWQRSAQYTPRKSFPFGYGSAKALFSSSGERKLEAVFKVARGTVSFPASPAPGVVAAGP